MIFRQYKSMRHRYAFNVPFIQRGFTMLEVVVAIMIVAGMTVLLSNAFAPYLSFKQRMDSGDRLKELLKATEVMYMANAFSIDNVDQASSDPAFPGLGQLALDNGVTTRILSTACPAKSAADNVSTIRDPSDIRLGPVPQVVNLSVLQSYAGRGVEDFAKDGFNNVTCVLVSRRAKIMYSGLPLYYHVIAYISPGANNRIELGTDLVKTTVDGVDVWTLNVAGDDKGVVFDGSKIAIENYKVTKARLDRFARAYEIYFKIRYQSRFSRDAQFNYFYASNSAANEVNGEPRVGLGDAVQASYVEPEYWPSPTTATLSGWYNEAFSNVIDTGMWRILGLNDTDLLDAWNNPITVDSFSPRVRPGARNGNPQVPPFSVQFGAFLPGVLECQSDMSNPINSPTTACPAYMTSTSVSTY